MYIEEKIEVIKKNYSHKDFKVPYTSHTRIMKKIEGVFIIKQNLNMYFNLWNENLKGVKLVYQTNQYTADIVEKLVEDGTNYWFVIVEGIYPEGRHRLFDAKPSPALFLWSWLNSRWLYIVDKKYNWLVLIERQQDYSRKIYYVGQGLEDKMNN